MPRWAPTACAMGFLAASATYGIVLGGHGQSVAENVTSATGFAIETIEMDGLQRVAEFQILEALELREHPSLMMFDADGARERIDEIAWVENASIQKLYPGTLKVTIEEQVPYALWQRGDVISVITEAGDVITDEVDGRYANLLRVVNHGAQRRAGEIKKELDRIPELRARVRAASLISERRWDLNLENGIVVRLPEVGIAEALDDLVRLDAEGGILSRDIVAVDMRLEDRVVVRLSDEAALRRKTAIKARPRRGVGGADT
ncbi:MULTISPECIES: cell division protein FtsQ/DivIB [Pseudovibrio]|uniref:cell division protein FtsQ/DivIB n=1 Tax=Stappiaceae TaxID=2821832 RepID=UPI0023674089|nr:MULTISPECIES: cell division protein FtsQ/DivIB [Pseudovibrio]MDD7910324.1 cell division protein FtsQ/DivIB [Pseudovibrio exalbescens]MDX5594039.1 cell division protein FtsQ/DivIB [Pseudovibrio sp. SPO723]